MKRHFLSTLMKQNHLILSSVLCLFLCAVALPFSCRQAAALGIEAMTPEADVGLSAESLPAEKKFEIPTLTARTVQGSPVIDGKIDEDFWKQADHFELNYELYPIRLAPAVVKTEAFVASTRTHAYIAFIAHDPTPGDIRSALRERDGSKEDDYVSVIVDPTGALAKKYEFRVNPDGTLSDVLQDAISERYIYDWDTEWEGAAQRTETGYTVEIAIPADAIRFPPSDSPEHANGFVILKRSYPRSVDRILATFFHFQVPTEKSDKGAILSTVRWKEQGIREFIDLPGKLTATPHYIYHFDEVREIGGEFKQSPDRDEHSVGLDLEYDFSTATSFAATIYPNFTEVEADIARQSINNPFTIFQPEKRTFFKTATEYYNSIIPVVYTRNILNPRLGASFIHDNAVDSYSAFAIDDRETQVIMPDNLGSDTVELLDSSLSTALRVRRSRDMRTTGFTATHRLGEDRYHNTTVNADGMFDFGPDDKFRYQLSFSQAKYPKSFAEDLCNSEGCTEDLGEQSEEPCLLGECATNARVLRTGYGENIHGHNLQLRYKHDGPNGLYWFGYEQSSGDYRADLGFVRKIDIRSLNFAYGRKWYFRTWNKDKGQSRFRTYMLGKLIRSYEFDDKLEQSLSLWAEFKGTYQSLIRVGYWFRDRAVNRIDQSTLDTGDNAPLFDERYVQWYFETAPFPSWKLNLDGRIGETADAANLVLGDLLELKPKLTYRYDRVELTAGGTFRNFKLDDERLYKEQFLTLSTLYRPNRKMSHRLLYLDNLTERDTERWRGTELSKEYDKTVEYTFTLLPKETWKILAGLKFEYSYESDIDESDLTERQIYCKIEKTF